MGDQEDGSSLFQCLIYFARGLASSAALAMCTLFAVIWVESYSRQYTVSIANGEELFFVHALRAGHMEFLLCSDEKWVPVSMGYELKSYPTEYIDSRFAWFGFQFMQISPEVYQVIMPCWGFVLVALALMVVAKPPPRHKFSLLELMIGISTLAIVLASTEMFLEYQ